MAKYNKREIFPKIGEIKGGSEVVKVGAESPYPVTIKCACGTLHTYSSRWTYHRSVIPKCYRCRRIADRIRKEESEKKLNKRLELKKLHFEQFKYTKISRKVNWDKAGRAGSYIYDLSP
jgi:hypothetical protein